MDWVLDITDWDRYGLEGPRRYLAVLEGDVVNLCLITDEPPGRVIGVYHEAGRTAAAGWARRHPEIMEELGLPVPND